jgi:hypothetical protein
MLPIILNGPQFPSTSFARATLPAVYANGNGSEMVRFVRAGARARDNCVLLLPRNSIYYFDLTQQHNRWRRRSRIDHQR